MQQSLKVFIVCIIMLISFCSFDAVALNQPIITVSTEKCEVGNDVNVKVLISNNPGIVSMTLRLSYDDTVFTLKNVSDGGLLGANAHKPERTSPYTLAWANDTAKENFTKNGTLVTLTFAVAEDAPCGTYPINISYDYEHYDIYDKEVNRIAFEIQNGSITVKKSENISPISDFTYKFINEEICITGYNGNSKQVYIAESYFVNEHEYPVTMIDEYAFEAKTEIVDIVLPKSIVSIGDYAFSGCENLTIHCNKNSYVMNYAIQNNIKYELIIIIGDPSGDGVIDANDLTYFRKALLSGNDSFDERLDVTGDGIFNLLDLVRIKKYLADNTVPLGRQESSGQPTEEIANLPENKQVA